MLGANLASILSLAQNTALLLLGVFAYTRLKEPLGRKSRWVQTAADGFMFGVLVVVSMTGPFSPSPGIFIDSRNSLIGCATLLFGPATGLIASLGGVLYRFWIGGAGVPAGTLGIALTFLASLAFRLSLGRRSIEPGYWQLLALGVIVSACMVASSVAFPSAAVAFDVIRQATLPVLLIVPLTTLLFGAITLRSEESLRLTREVADGEARLRAVLDYLPYPLAIRDMAGRYTHINRTTAERFGARGEDFIGKTRDQALQELGIEIALGNIDQTVLKDGTTVKVGPVEIAYRGEKQWLIIWNFPVRNAKGEIEAIGGTSADVTDFVTARQALERREETLQRHRKALLDIIHSGVIAAGRPDQAAKIVTEIVGAAMEVERTSIFVIESNDNRHRCIDLWDRGKARHGLAADIMSTTNPALFVELDRERVVACDNVDADARLASRVAYFHEFGIRSVLTAGIYVEGKMRGHLDFAAVGEERPWSSEEVTFARSVADLMAQVFLASDRDELQRRLRQSERVEAIGRLAGGVAHDFNNLLGSIMGFAGFLKQDLRAGSEESRFAERIVGACERGRTLVAQILSLAKSGSEAQAIVDLRGLLHENEELLAASFPSSTRWVYRYPDEPALVMGSEAQLHQLIMNLCVNANDALEGRPGAILVRLACVGSRDEDYKSFGGSASDRVCVGQLDPARPYALIEVEDCGVGMNRDVLAHVTEPFFTTKDRGRGTGLGLAVVHGVITAHGGAYCIQSAPGVGTRVSAYLPLAPRMRAVSPARTSLPADVRGSERVLVIDDEEDMADMMAIGLGRLGYDAVGVIDPAEALQSVQADLGAWDVVVTDQIMPGMRGLALTKKVKELRPDIKVIVCTGFSDNASEGAARDAGADGFFLKPVAPRQIAERIRILMRSTSG